MLVRLWINEILDRGTVNFERLRAEVMRRAADNGLPVSSEEVRVVLEKLIRNGEIETCQYLAEDQCYRATVYDDSNIYWYFFRRTQLAQS